MRADRMMRTAPAMLLGLAAFGAAFAATRWWRTPAASPGSAPPGMVWIPGGEFAMGTDAKSAWPDERPSHRVRVTGFWIDATEVTNAHFRRFVEATGYVTTAETAPSAEEILKQLPPGTPPPAKES